MDLRTQQAFALLKSLVRSSPDRKHRQALEVLHHSLGADVAERTTNHAIIVSRPTRRSDFDWPSVPPSPRELETFVRAARAVRRHGALPRGEVRFNWFEASSDRPLGQARRDDDGGVTIELQRGLTEYDLFRTVVHELQHAVDIERLGRAWTTVPHEEREQMARAVEARVLRAEGFYVI